MSLRELYEKKFQDIPLGKDEKMLHSFDIIRHGFFDINLVMGSDPRLGKMPVFSGVCFFLVSYLKQIFDMARRWEIIVEKNNYFPKSHRC